MAFERSELEKGVVFLSARLRTYEKRLFWKKRKDSPGFDGKERERERERNAKCVQRFSFVVFSLSSSFSLRQESFFALEDRVTRPLFALFAVTSDSDAGPIVTC